MKQLSVNAKTSSLLCVFMLISCSYFYSGGGWNQAAHFDLVRALVEKRTTRIDDYKENTGDVSYANGHYYSNKPPGTAFTATPAYALIRLVAHAVGADPQGEGVLFLASWVSTFLTATIPVAACAVLIFWIGLCAGLSRGWAIGGSLLFGLGTPAWVYGTIMFTHSLSAVCLLIAFVCANRIENDSTGRARAAFAGAAGLSAGWAVLTELQAIGAALIICALPLWNSWKRSKADCARTLGWIACGALLPAIALLSYQACAFGSPFQVSHQTSMTTIGDKHGRLGLAGPRIEIMIQLLIGAYRGLLPAAPILAIAPFGFASLIKDPKYRVPALAALGIFIYYWLVGSSLSYWVAGWCFGPRYLFPGVVFLAIGLGPGIARLYPQGKWFVLAVSAVSIFINLVAVSTNPFPVEGLNAPFLTYLLPSFLESNISLNSGAFATNMPSRATNLGELMGLRGLASLMPLFGIWAVLGTVWYRRIWRAERRTDGSPVPATH